MSTPISTLVLVCISLNADTFVQLFISLLAIKECSFVEHPFRSLFFYFHFSLVLFLYHTVFIKSIYEPLYIMDVSPLSKIWTTDNFPAPWLDFHALNDILQ